MTTTWTHAPQDSQPFRAGGPVRVRYAPVDYVTLLWRELGLMIVVFLIVFAIGAALAFTLKKDYTAASSLFVRVGQEYVYQPRAGDAGRGFAVVADEISKLADQTTSSIKSIDSLIRTNEQEIINGNRNVSETVGKINSIISDIEKIVEKITVISNKMSEQTVANQTVNENAEKVKVRSEQITNAMSEQKLAIEEISKTVGSINDLSQHNTHQIIQITDSTKSIVTMVEKMHLDIERFAGRDREEEEGGIAPAQA